MIHIVRDELKCGVAHKQTFVVPSMPRIMGYWTVMYSTGDVDRGPIQNRY